MKSSGHQTQKLTRDLSMGPNLKYPLKKMEKSDQIIDAQADRPAIWDNVKQCWMQDVIYLFAFTPIKLRNYDRLILSQKIRNYEEACSIKRHSFNCDN